MKKIIDKKQEQGFENEVNQFLDIQAETDNYSDEDLAKLFSNEKMQQVLNITAECKQVLIDENEASTPDINAEWENFKQKNFTNKPKATIEHQVSKVTTHFAYKIAASIASVIMLSGVVLAAIHWQYMRSNRQQESAVIDSTNNNNHNSVIATEESQAKNDSTVCATPTIKNFENVELGEILTEMGKFYCKQVVLKGENAHLRLRFEWNQALSLEENIKILNSFEHIHIALEGESITIQ